jgi:hypothetical protein
MGAMTAHGRLVIAAGKPDVMTASTKADSGRRPPKAHAGLEHLG